MVTLTPSAYGVTACDSRHVSDYGRFRATPRRGPAPLRPSVGNLRAVDPAVLRTDRHKPWLPALTIDPAKTG